MKTRRTALGLLAATAGVALTLATGPGVLAATATAKPAAPVEAPSAQPLSYIVKAPSLAMAKAAVQGVGGRITHELGIIEAVGADLTPGQAEALRADGALTLTGNASARVAGATSAPYAVAHTGADQLHAMGITGKGVSIAFVDTGLWATPLAGYDAINNVTSNRIKDDNGHGTHITSIAASANVMADGKYLGIAPGAGWVTVKTFGADGSGTYANTIRGLNWILANKAKYNIRVVNMSFGATAQSYYWNDPLAQAAMKLWQAGIVVVASAGNWGPNAQSISVPGNVPYVITVGAMTDNYTPANTADDRLASFSSTGPTYEGFVKPEIVAAGGHLTGVMTKSQTIPKAHQQFHSGGNYFTMSGTSQSAAVVSGVVALMLQSQPWLTPDQVKCKLTSSARPAVDGSNKLSYSVFQQGAGQVDALAAVSSSDITCGNAGLDIAADLAGTKHFAGPARQKPDGSFFIADADGAPVNEQGYLWKNDYLWNQGYVWKKDYVSNSGYLWKQGYVWKQGYLWKNSALLNQSFVPSTTSVSGVNHWVDQE